MNDDKISIYLPKSLRAKLEADAVLFEVFKKNHTDININRFLGNLITGYFEQFFYETQEKELLVSAVLKRNIKKYTIDNIDDVTKEILQSLSNQSDCKAKENNTRVSLKPTRTTAPLIEDIKNACNDESISTTFRRLFSSYLALPTYTRERIIYKENYELLTQAIESGKSVTFNTTKNRDITHIVHPYKIVFGTEEIFNYLLCSEMDSEGILRARTYRLCRIENLRNSRTSVDFTGTVKEYLERMIKYSPAYEINDDDICCVYLSEKGHESYKQIYFQRPPHSNIEKIRNGYLYFFDCSKNHIIQYFRRFNPGEAIILNPKALRKTVKESYEQFVDSYEKAKTNNREI